MTTSISECERLEQEEELTRLVEAKRAEIMARGDCEWRYQQTSRAWLPRFADWCREQWR